MSERERNAQKVELEKNLKKIAEEQKLKQIPPTKIIEDTEKDRQNIEEKLIKELENMDDYDEAKFQNIMYDISDELRSLA
jgi:transcriptional/translational regulatory protein YebC/TACO1